MRTAFNPLPTGERKRVGVLQVVNWPEEGL